VAEASPPFLPIDIELVRDFVHNTRFANIIYTEKTGSTNDDAFKVLGQAQYAGTTFVADEQTAGKGRKLGRRWIAPPGTSVLFTTILPLTVPASELWAVPFWVALAVADGIRRSCAVNVDLRWPNDLFVRNRKVGGILCISRVSGDLAHVGCGVGINGAPPRGYGAAGIEPPPGYLLDVARRVSRELVLSEILVAFNRRLAALRSPSTIASTYAERAGLIGSRYSVRMDIDGALFEGTARGLGPDGALRLEVGGSERLIALADARRV
jgi:BirA family transcriptional regulator, biotin operon repressor / biotin---[acetyl-CoA-carboxylase] ligase